MGLENYETFRDTHLRREDIPRYELDLEGRFLVKVDSAPGQCPN